MDLKKIVSITPLIGSFLVFLGFIKLNYYYQHWNINIISYLDFSEILLSFLNDVNILLVFTFLMLLQALIGIGTIAKIYDLITKQRSRKLETNETNENSQITNVPTVNNPKFVQFMDETIDNNPKSTIWMALIFMVTCVTLFLWLNYLTFLYLSFVFSSIRNLCS